MEAAQHILLWLIIGLFLFFLVNWIGRHSKPFGYVEIGKLSEIESANTFNFVFRVATPLVFLLIIATIFYRFDLDSWVVDIHYSIIAYIAIRLAFNWIRGRLPLLDWRKLILQWAVLIGASFFTYEHIIKTRDFLIPDMKTVGNEVWLAIAAYLYVLSNQIEPNHQRQEQRARNYIRNRMVSFLTKYGALVDGHTSNDKLKLIIYAVMLVEDFNRPRVYRETERILFRIGKAKTLGIMQTSTDRILSDEESVQKGMQMISKALAECIDSPAEWIAPSYILERCGPDTIMAHEEQQIIHKTLTRYNPSGDYAREVQNCMELIKQEFFKNSNDSIHPDTNKQAHQGALIA
jgi:hypothetical protein